MQMVNNHFTVVTDINHVERMQLILMVDVDSWSPVLQDKDSAGWRLFCALLSLFLLFELQNYKNTMEKLTFFLILSCLNWKKMKRGHIKRGFQNSHPGISPHLAMRILESSFSFYSIWGCRFLLFTFVFGSPCSVLCQCYPITTVTSWLPGS